MSSDKEDRTADDSSEERSSSRRDFLKVALSFSLVLALVGVASLTRSLFGPAPSAQTTTTTTTTGTGASSPFPRVKVANLTDIKANAPIPFNYPLDDEPNILVKLGQKAAGGVGPDGDIVAYSQLCQHLGCVFGYTRPGSSPTCDSSFTTSGPVGYCCCHGSVFDFAKGAQVVSGPSPRPLPQVILEVDAAGDIYATGMTLPTIFGHNTGSNDVTADLQGGNLVG
jgi:arsenite oxidase small subunit